MRKKKPLCPESINPEMRKAQLTGVSLEEFRYKTVVDVLSIIVSNVTLPWSEIQLWAQNLGIHHHLLRYCHPDTDNEVGDEYARSLDEFEGRLSSELAGEEDE